MRRIRIVLPILVLFFIFMLGILLTNPSKAQVGPIWLPFDGKSAPSEPALTLLNASPTEIQLHASLPGAYADSVTAEGYPYTRLTAPGYGFPASYGLPELPVLRREVEIPFGAQLSIEVISAQFTDNSLGSLGLNPIYPLQLPVPKAAGVEDNQPFTIDAKYYANGGRYPSNVISIGEPYIVRGHRIVMVEVWPVAYDPSQASLRLYSQVTFQLDLSGSDMSATNRLAQRYSSPVFDPSLSNRVINFNQGLPLAVNGQVGYLIITADAYAGALQPLVDLRSNRGFAVTLTKLSAIPYGSTAQGIKSYIQTAYDTWPIPPSYVLLVGDTDTMPAWSSPVISTFTDLYYATMDGDSDWHPDIGRGRFPVRSVEQTTAMVDKYIFYAGLTGQEPWLKTASFPASCDGSNYGVAEGSHNYVIGNYTAPGGWTGTFPQNPNPGGDQLYCISNSATHQDLVDQFNQGRWAIIYSGHGYQGGWEMDYTQTDIQNMPANTMYPFVASHACLTGDFGFTGQDEVFGETWVLQANKGAMIYWGSATYSYWGEDDVLERSMFDGLFTNTSPHADVTAMTYTGLAGVEAAFPSSAQYYWETYNILGDPSVHLFMEPDQPAFSLNLDPAHQEVCVEGTVTSTAEIGSILGYSSTVYLESGDLPFNVAASFDPAQAPAPYTSTLTLDVSAGAPEGDHTIIITATDHVSQTLYTSLDLRINTTLPGAPWLLSPEDGATNQPSTPTFDWSDLPLVDSYNFELATSPLFETPIITASHLLSSGFIQPEPLEGGTCYWWHAQADNACGTSLWSDPFHFRTIDLGVLFSDDLESGAGQWSHAANPGIDHWVVSTDQSHSSTHAWFVPDDEVVTDTSLWTTETIQLSDSSLLTFWHRYQFEDPDYDGAVLEISTDAGNTWSDLGPHITANGYTGVINSGYSNPLGGRQGWTGDLLDWTQVTVDLSTFAGQDVMIRWRLGSDSSVSDVGWYIDDVEITAPLPPGPPPTLVSISPDSASHDMQTVVVITGTNFIGSPALKLGDTWLGLSYVMDPERILAVVPAGLPLGTYDLTIYNGDCQSDTLEGAFTVLEGDDPITGLRAANDSPTVLGSLTTFTATVDTGTNVLYTWDFGDGTSADGQMVTHVYSEVGAYTAKVFAHNFNNAASTTTEVTIIVPPQVFHLIYLPVTFK